MDKKSKNELIEYFMGDEDSERVTRNDVKGAIYAYLSREGGMEDFDSATDTAARDVIGYILDKTVKKARTTVREIYLDDVFTNSIISFHEENCQTHNISCEKLREILKRIDDEIEDEFVYSILEVYYDINPSVTYTTMLNPVHIEGITELVKEKIPWAFEV
jgi:hypothetical protein